MNKVGEAMTDALNHPRPMTAFKPMAQLRFRFLFGMELDADADIREERLAMIKRKVAERRRGRM